ncbi:MULTISPECIES: thiamine pyrophosphate-binding protein [unclassified Amycolatopsis]|uniref:thiamine pyrophosphate-binding protein n=1 Tax=unclassified Amycolatopsis TaxID=2618356 RepID=UPI00287684FF|nr:MULTISPECIES: thiamine pyrophosphate-binding protein [unclassified Amycolatopsis]MDS0137692.1 hypothetical protein [Amycolatopsis sp. 505]MDS0141887.1 hypothetical protein [Amycolatopsis sp. CM201R]
MTDLVSVLVRERARGGVRQAFGVDHVAARHEGGAMAMADACYRATGETAVCATVHKAGLSNTATALSEAVKHRSSVIVICGDAPTGGPRPFDMNTAGFADAIGARAVRVTAGEPVRRPACQPAEVDAVLHRLVTARRPLVLAFGASLDAIDAAELVRTDWRDVAEPMPAGVGWAQEPYTDVSTTERIDPRTLSLELAGIPPAERTVALGGGRDGGALMGLPGPGDTDPIPSFGPCRPLRRCRLPIRGAPLRRRRGRYPAPGRHGTHRRSCGRTGSASEETAGPVTGNHNRQAITGSACPDVERTFNDRDS